MGKEIIESIRSELRQMADENTKMGFTRFFKEEVAFFGVKTATVEKIAACYFPQIKSRGKREILGLSEELLKSGYQEEAIVAFDWSYRLRQQYSPDDFAIFERWLEKYVNNWAKCDTLCNHTIGTLVEKYPQYLENLKQWTKSDNRWLRRAAAVTLIIPAKKGMFLTDILEIATGLLEDRDDLVQKGYGWMLKEASRQHQSVIFDYVMKNKSKMPRTALRYAIEKMPPEMKRQAMN